jgi:hypothetical protein
MKQQDIALIIVIAAISGVISFFASGALFASNEMQEQTVSKIDPITAELAMPSQKYFNDKSVNPTQLVQVGDNNNDNPFNSAQ